MHRAKTRKRSYRMLPTIRKAIWKIRQVSVFCAHGAGFVVPWDQVEDYMHLNSGVELNGLDSETWYDDVDYAEKSGYSGG